MYYVYLLECSDGTLYCGLTNNIDKRLKEHNEGKGRGAKYTSGRRPVRLVYTEKKSTRSSALKREYEIKKMKREEKLHLYERKIKIKKSKI